MKNEKYRSYLYWGVTSFVVLALSAALVFLFIKIEWVRGTIRAILRILAPIIYGAVMAYLLTPIYNHIRDWVFEGTRVLFPRERVRRKFGSMVATIVSLAVLAIIVLGLISMIIPQLISSVVGIVEALPTSIYNLQLWLEKILADNPDVEAMVMDYYDDASSYIQKRLTNEVLPNAYNIVQGVSSSVFSVLNVVKNILIGVIVMVYLLNIKDRLMTQAKMIVYGLFPLRVANKILEEARYAHHVFGGFILGKLLDSLIIGILCFVLLNFMKMPYVLLISVIVGVTNVVPFFGPFIGAIPSAFLILLVSPMKCLYFIIFIFLLQQFDGNILGPKILGDSTGISSFWVLFSILLFGGLFGFAGMIIAVPTFAVAYKLVTEFVVYRLGKKKLSADIKKYDNLQYIDEEQKTYIEK